MMCRHPTRAQLKAVLADIYLDSSRAKVLAKDAGLDLRQIKFSDRATDNWNAILEEAEHQHLVAAVLDIAVSEYGDNQLLRDARRAYEAWVADGRQELGGISASPREVPRPFVKSPSDLPEVARYNFDRTAWKYHRSINVGHAMQAGNAKRLVNLFCEVLSGKAAPRERPKKPENCLDAGCGTGLVTMFCHEHRHDANFQWYKQCSKRIGIDYAPHMLQVVRVLDDEKCYTHVIEADIRNYDQDVLEKDTGLRNVDLILANNVFHWLFDENAIRRAFRTSYEILDKNGGCLAASIAAAGTGQLFRTAYTEEVAGMLDQDKRDTWKRHLENPIGLQRLDSIVRIAREIRFKIAIAHLEYEPIEFESTDAYVEAARGYGEEVFMAPLLLSTLEEREQIWDRIKKNFRDRYATVAESDAGYVHDQFMIYIIAVRRD